MRWIPILILSLFVLSCGSDDDNRLQELLDSGWSEFNAGNFPTARDHFMDAVREDPNSAAAYNGTGWSLMRLHEDESSDADYLEGVYGSFQTALRLDPNLLSAAAGTAFTCSRLGDSGLTIYYAGHVLDLGGESWSDPHVTVVNARAMHRLRAWEYFQQEEFALAEVEVETVLDVDLDPESDTYLSDLLAAIASL